MVQDARFWRLPPAPGLELTASPSAVVAESIRCRLCGGPAQRRLRAKDYNRRLATRWFTYHLCTRCRSLSMAEPPADLASFYPDDYYRLPASVEELATVAEGERYKLEIVQRFVKAGRLLEIGPAVGGFAFLAKRAGFQVETIEMDARCCDFLRDVVGVGVTHTADARSVLRSSGQFEAIALWHVLEHLPDPWETLEAAAAALSPGGVLVLAAPNPDAIQFLIFKSYWTHLDAPRHLQLIPIRALRERAMSWGLLPIFSTTTDPGGLGWNAFGWQMSFRNLAGARVGKVPTLVGRAAGRIARPVERSGLRGSTYTLAFQKASRP